jgi:ketosteroid isomerase-like protein
MMTDGTPARYQRTLRMYDAFNARDLDALVAFLHEDVDWPDGEARLHGREAVRAHWSRQWTRLRVRDEVTGIDEVTGTADLGPDRTAVRIRQVVHGLDGALLSTGAFTQTYEFRDGLVARMDVQRIDEPRDKGSDNMDDEATLRRMYEGFNRRDVPAVLALMSEDVAWANGVEGGHEKGREAVRAYWARQWAGVQVRVEPLAVARRERGVVAVEVHQVARDLEGHLLLDETVRHVFRLEKGLVARFDIEKAGGLASLAQR